MPPRAIGGPKGWDMKANRRDFIKTSVAFGVLGVTKTGAHAASPPTKIGFVVSTRDQPNHLLAFLQALNDAGWGPITNKTTFSWASADGRYGSTHDDLQTLAKKHIRIHGVNMIVAAGGLMTAIGVAKALDAIAPQLLPFVYLIGRSPAAADNDAASFFNSTYKAGGVDQNVPAQNEQNFQQLKNQPNSTVTADRVGLIVNDNNAMSKPEVDLWVANGHPRSFVYQLAGENDKQLSVLFQKISSGPQPAGMVVSSDPYFRSVGPEFDTRLHDATGGAFSGWVCYPYREYLDQDPVPTSRSILSNSTPPLATDDPADQKSAYYQLGEKAVALLTALNKSPPPTSTPNVGITTWNGSAWV